MNDIPNLVRYLTIYLNYIHVYMIHDIQRCKQTRGMTHLLSYSVYVILFAFQGDISHERMRIRIPSIQNILV